jgi:D-xylose transport system permease protein
MSIDLDKTTSSEPPADTRGSFQADLTPRSPRQALIDYFNKLRSGDPGALPSVLGIIALGLIFAQVSSRFLGKGNLGNLPSQGAFIAIIALGLVFVLILGEIDLAAGTTGGMCAAFAARSLSQGGFHHGTPGFLFWSVIVAMLGAIIIAVMHKMYVAPAVISIGLILIATGLDKREVTSILMAVCIGVAVGVIIGVLVAKVGIPSFVVTLALFLAWQGIFLFALSSQPIDVTRYNFWYGLAHNNMSPFWGWVFFVVCVGGYLLFTLAKATSRRRAGLSADTITLVLIRAGAIAVLGAVVVAFLNQNRNPNTGPAIEGVPWALSIPIALMIVLTIVLTKTTWGRHLYATGGNEEAARRAGIQVDKIKIGAFAMGSGLAALGGVFLSSKTGGVQLDLGQGNTLLFSVAAAVIGGTSLFGGRGKPRDAIIGALVIAIIPNGIGLKASLAPQYNQIITGGVLLLAASVDSLSRRRAGSGR